jgi:hypothetical protein
MICREPLLYLFYLFFNVGFCFFSKTFILINFPYLCKLNIYSLNFERLFLIDLDIDALNKNFLPRYVLVILKLDAFSLHQFELLIWRASL